MQAPGQVDRSRVAPEPPSVHSRLGRDRAWRGEPEISCTSAPNRSRVGELSTSRRRVQTSCHQACPNWTSCSSWDTTERPSDSAPVAHFGRYRAALAVADPEWTCAPNLRTEPRSLDSSEGCRTAWTYETGAARCYDAEPAITGEPVNVDRRRCPARRTSLPARTARTDRGTRSGRC